MSWEKTDQSVDNLVASFIDMFARIFHKGTSSRVLVLAGTIVYEYMLLQQSGFSGVELAVCAAVGGITGVSFIGFKTAENAQIIKLNGNT